MRNFVLSTLISAAEYILTRSFVKRSGQSQQLGRAFPEDSTMQSIERILSRPTAKPYRSNGIEDQGQPCLNEDGLLDFSPNDIESKKFDWYTNAFEC